MQIDLRKATITISDGTLPTPKSISVKVGEGNLTFSEKHNVEYKLDRGLLDKVRLGDEVPLDLKFDFVWEWISGTAAPVVVMPNEAITGTGEAEIDGWVSSDSDACRPYAVDIEVEYDPGTVCGADKETITFTDFRWESLDFDIKAGTISCSGKCNITTPVVDREAQA